MDGFDHRHINHRGVDVFARNDGAIHQMDRLWVIAKNVDVANVETLSEIVVARRCYGLVYAPETERLIGALDNM
jgi:hypothetical protein